MRPGKRDIEIGTLGLSTPIKRTLFDHNTLASLSIPPLLYNAKTRKSRIAGYCWVIYKELQGSTFTYRFITTQPPPLPGVLLNISHLKWLIMKPYENHDTQRHREGSLLCRNTDYISPSPYKLPNDCPV